MKIPVFISCPSLLNAKQEQCKNIIFDELEHHRLEPRTLGKSDYPTNLPLREVFVLATHCSGGIILGFEQFYAPKGVLKRGTGGEKEVDSGISFSTPWNQLETGILFTLRLPILVFREKGISGGVFNPGVTDVFIHKMPLPGIVDEQREELREVFLKWQAKVREHYYHAA